MPHFYRLVTRLQSPSSGAPSAAGAAVQMQTQRKHKEPGTALTASTAMTRKRPFSLPNQTPANKRTTQATRWTWKGAVAGVAPRAGRLPALPVSVRFWVPPCQERLELLLGVHTAVRRLPYKDRWQHLGCIGMIGGMHCSPWEGEGRQLICIGPSIALLQRFYAWIYLAVGKIY